MSKHKLQHQNKQQCKLNKLQNRKSLQQNEKNKNIMEIVSMRFSAQQDFNSNRINS